ncbi:MAG: hypothetical protein IT374_00925 [Polyangiaceae bacterium]|nr:hypothetical protein [Polyangiaceae bacterium]
MRRAAPVASSSATPPSPTPISRGVSGNVSTSAARMSAPAPRMYEPCGIGPSAVAMIC